jgi:phosphatidylglycerol lysyltransferase
MTLMNFQPSEWVGTDGLVHNHTRSELAGLRDHSADATRALGLYHFEGVLREATYGGPPAIAGLLGDKEFMLSPSGRSAICFARKRHHMIALAEPVGQPDEIEPLIVSFLAEAARKRCKPSFYAVTPAFAECAARHGLRMVKIGERALLDLTTFSMGGKDRQVIRTHRNRHMKAGYSVSVFSPRTARHLEPRLREISDQWLARNGGREKAFALGTHDPVYVHSMPIAVVKAADGSIPAYATLWPGADRQRIGIDLMRSADDAPNGVMDYLFAELFLWAQAEGYQQFDLNTAPLSGVALDPALPVATSLARMTFEYGEKFYNFKGVRRFKQKFHPVWEEVFVAMKPNASPLSAVAHAAMLINTPYKRVQP